MEYARDGKLDTVHVEMSTDSVMPAGISGTSTLVNQLTILWFVSWTSGLMRWSLYSQAIWYWGSEVQFQAWAVFRYGGTGICSQCTVKVYPPYMSKN